MKYACYKSGANRRIQLWFTKREVELLDLHLDTTLSMEFATDNQISFHRPGPIKYRAKNASSDYLFNGTVTLKAPICASTEVEPSIGAGGKFFSIPKLAATIAASKPRKPKTKEIYTLDDLGAAMQHLTMIARNLNVELCLFEGELYIKPKGKP